VKKGRRLVAAKAGRDLRLLWTKPHSGEREQDPDEAAEQQSCKAAKRPTAGTARKWRVRTKLGAQVP